MATAEDYNKMPDSEKKKEDWMNSKWRPMMGWMYMAVCLMDFVIFPVMWSLIQAAHGGRVETQWQPITLQGAGLFHMAMGAIIGVAAFGRTQEKLAGANNGGIHQNNNYGNPQASQYQPSSPQYQQPTPQYMPPQVSSAPAPITYSASGKPKPPEQIDPIL
jgi:hypothetical protein